MRRLASVITLLLLAAPAAAGPAPTQAELRAQIEALTAEITAYQQQLAATRAEKSELEAELQANEKRINSLLGRIKELEAELGEGERRTEELEAQKQSLYRAKDQQQELLAQQLLAAHRIGGQGYLKLLLTQDSPDRLARLLKYYEYLGKAHSQQIAAYSATLLALDGVSAALREENARRAAALSQLRAQQQALAAAQAQRRQTLAALAAEDARTGQRLAQLRADRQQLEGILTRIARLAQLSLDAGAPAFAAMQGQLLLPVSGAIAQRFGSQRSGGQLKWKGLVIAAAEGEPVHAIYDGRVVYADWLRGFGLLLILSHGQGYLSLYGHNQALHRQAGDWVHGGEVIAAVGDTGGQPQSGLYFEIRNQGQPTDPQLWCRARPAA